ncbi:hypothetical protein EIN_502070 [Entamoeba invadens IP1]|uniref:Uncharacterized protein n=1 Tax=Entamoeba invadens IP1 TaxID=370355 RepID=A0A0A1TZN3_ENTIV|nr:hypothetical protein EIN_502070 [Entamoeba invadens IP1]ELP84094.1 hypothetical protein EIN_502070 [Entamoeba invadens IP1]|eukprot:XP_004183440.1 hypothetical protein EIN_502070 [Entamoeba invadens IP1]
MVFLESFFLKNVILYLESLDDVLNFMLINRTCCQSVQTLYITPYRITQTNNILDVMDYFPSLETMYLHTPKTAILRSVGKEVPNFEIWVPKPYSSFSNLFETKWLPPKIKKLRVSYPDFLSVAKNFSVYHNLKELSLDLFNIQSRDLQICGALLSLQTLRRVVLYIPLSALDHFLSLNCVARKEVNFVFVVLKQFCQIKTTPNETDFHPQNFKKNCENVKVFFQFLSEETVDFDFLPITESQQFYIEGENTGLFVCSEMANQVDLIQRRIDEGLFTRVVLYQTKERYTLAVMKKQILKRVTADLSSIINVKTFVVTHVKVRNFIFPKCVEHVSISDVTGSFTIESKKVKTFKLCCSRVDVFNLCVDNIRTLDIEGGEVVILHRNNIFNNTFVVDLEKTEYFRFEVGKGLPKVLTFVIENDGKRMSEVKARSLKFVKEEGRLNVGGPVGDINLEHINLSVLNITGVVEIKNNEEEINNIRIGTIGKASFFKGEFNTLQLKQVRELNLHNCTIQKLKVDTVNKLKEEKTVVKEKLIKNWKQK